MRNWNEIRMVVEQVLRQQRCTKSENHYGKPCFLTAYQIAVLVDKVDSKLKGDLVIGGQGEGDKGNSFSQKIAWHLSKDFNDDVFNGSLEIQFLNLKGLNSFTFNDGNTPSVSEVSMFRLV
jgi:hypothetical protein